MKLRDEILETRNNPRLYSLASDVRTGLVSIEEAIAEFYVGEKSRAKSTLLREIGKRPWLVLAPLVLGFVLGLLTHIWF